MAEDLDPAPIIEEILQLATEARVPIRHVSRTKLESSARTDGPQGVIARAAALEPVGLETLLSPGDGPPFLVAVDGVTDPGNLGALLRSAACAGATGVVLPRHRAVHVTPTVAKAAAGAIEYLPMAVVGGLPAALLDLAEAGVWTVGLDAAGDRPLWGLATATEAVALVLGAEGKGLSRLVRERCDEVVSIPMAGDLDSLNVAAAGAIACFEIARARATL